MNKKERNEESKKNKEFFEAVKLLSKTPASPLTRCARASRMSSSAR